MHVLLAHMSIMQSYRTLQFHFWILIYYNTHIHRDLVKNSTVPLFDVKYGDK